MRHRLDRRAAFLSLAFILTASLAVSGCGENAGPTGPAGPAGPAGPPATGAAPSIVFVGSAPALRATGADAQALRVRVLDAAGNRVVGLAITFRVLQGSGSVSPEHVVTDGLGECSTIFTSGVAAGATFVSAQAEWGSTQVAGVDSLWSDALSVSTPLLTTGSATALIPHWNENGTSLLIEDPVNFRLARVPVAGGDGAFVGNYRGGQTNLDGSARAAVFDPADSVLVLGPTGQVLEGPFYPHPATGYFFGDVRSVSWIEDGSRLAVASNTNALITTCDLDGLGGDAWEMPVWANQVVAAGSSSIVVYGSSEYNGGIFRIDLASHAWSQFVRDAGFYNNSYSPQVAGVTVDRLDQWLVYSAREATTGFYFTPDHDLFRMPSSGGEPTALLSSPFEEVFPEWSPDGTKLAFCSNRSANGFYNVYLLDFTEPGMPKRVAGLTRPGRGPIRFERGRPVREAIAKR